MVIDYRFSDSGCRFSDFGCSNESQKERNDHPEDPDSDRGGSAVDRVGSPDSEFFDVVVVPAVSGVFRTVISGRDVISFLIKDKGGDFN